MLDIYTGSLVLEKVKNNHKKYDQVFRNHPGPFPNGLNQPFSHLRSRLLERGRRKTWFSWITLKLWLNRNVPSSDVEAFMNSLIRKIVLNHRKNVVQGILDVLDKHSNPFLPEQFMSLCDLDRVSRILEDA